MERSNAYPLYFAQYLGSIAFPLLCAGRWMTSQGHGSLRQNGSAIQTVDWLCPTPVKAGHRGTGPVAVLRDAEFLFSTHARKCSIELARLHSESTTNRASHRRAKSFSLAA